MNRKTKLGFILLSVALVAVVALAGVSALLAGGSTGPASVSDSAGMKGWVEWTVYDAAGNVKMASAGPNDVNNDPVLDDVVNTLLAGATVTAGNRIVLQSATTAAGVQIAPGDIMPEVHGKAGATAEACPVTATNRTNPVVGTPTAPSTGGQGTRSVTATFKACAASQAIAQLSLVKGIEQTTTNKTAIPNVDRLALQGVTITLALGDTLQVTWTLTASIPT